MSSQPDPDAPVDEVLAGIADAARTHDVSIGVAESLTCGALSSRLGAGPQASEWFRGGVVAYDESVKFDVLRVARGPVVTVRCASQMAAGAAELLRTDVALGITGVGGPEPSEGHPAGTVIMAVVAGNVHDTRTFHFPGDPEDVLGATVDEGVRLLGTAVRAHVRGRSG